ncbi:MAG: hypothetical protein M3R51_06395 [Candidatus Eremiobacteraeota bacterium]|nr:hypothetical protein [Candidatus Eremiobacteraeota bacterium]
MNDYVIGSGAVLSAGAEATITAATLHAQTDPGLAPSVKAAIFDFEATAHGDLTRVVLLTAGSNARAFHAAVSRPLIERRENSLAEVLSLLAAAAGTTEVHVFARWFPDDMLVASLRRDGVTLVAHSLDSVRQAALISGQTYRRWNAPPRAA